MYVHLTTGPQKQFLHEAKTDRILRRADNSTLITGDVNIPLALYIEQLGKRSRMKLNT